MSRKGIKNKKSKKIEFICGTCNKKWLDYPSRKGRKRFCSKGCAILSRKDILFKQGNKLMLGRHHSEATKKKISERHKGKIRPNISKSKIGSKNPNWSGEKVKYSGIHKWLVKEYGNANKCESITCDKKSKFYQWAKISDKLYERKRENFMMLCAGCHLRYDRHKLPREQK